MEGRKFSSSRSVVIYVRDFLARYQRRRAALLHRGRRPGDPGHRLHLVGVREAHQRRARRRLGQPGQPHGLAGRQELRLGPGTPARCSTPTTRCSPTVSAASTPWATLLAGSRQKAAISEAMRVVGEANKYLSDQAPWKLKNEDPARMETVLHVALQAVRTATRCCRRSCRTRRRRCTRLLGGTGTRQPTAGDPRGRRPRRRPRLPGHHRRLPERPAWARRRRRARDRARGADAGVHQARPVGGRGGAGPTRGRRVSQPAAAGTRSAVPVYDSHCHLDIGAEGRHDGPGGASGRRGAGAVPGRRHRRDRPDRLRPAQRRAGRSSWRPRPRASSPASRCTPTRRRGWRPRAPTSSRPPTPRSSAGRPPAGPCRRRDRPRPLPYRCRGPRPAGGVVPPAHRHGQGARQGAGDPRPRRPRRRPARARRRGRARTPSSSTASPATPRWPAPAPTAGWYLSFAGTVTFKNAANLRAALRWPRSTGCSSRPTRRSSRRSRTAGSPTRPT